MNKIIFLVILALFGCQSQKTQLELQTAKVAANFSKVSLKQEVTSEFLISPNGIGEAKLGMTLGQLKQISTPDTEFELVSPFTSDLNAISVNKQGLVQYYILYRADDADPGEFAPQDDDVITLLMTSNYNYQTEEGIKVGTPIEEAEDLYGDAVLSYNVDGESVEYITFKDYYSSDNIRFRASYFKLISDGLGFAGIYPEYPGVAYTTDKYQSDAAIAAIEVSCADDECSN